MGPETEYEIGAWADYDPQDMAQLEAGFEANFCLGTSGVLVWEVYILPVIAISCRRASRCLHEIAT